MFGKIALWNILALLILLCFQEAGATVAVDSVRPNGGVRLVVENETLSGFLGYLNKHYAVAVRLPESLESYPLSVDISESSFIRAIARALRPFSAAVVRDGHGRLKAIEVFTGGAGNAASLKAHSGVIEAGSLIADDSLVDDTENDIEPMHGEDGGLVDAVSSDELVAPNESNIFVSQDEAEDEAALKGEDKGMAGSGQLSNHEYAQAMRRHNRQQRYLVWQQHSLRRSLMSRQTPFHPGKRQWGNFIRANASGVMAGALPSQVKSLGAKDK